MIKGILFDFDGVLVPIDAKLVHNLMEEIIKKSRIGFSLTKEQAFTQFDKELLESKYDEIYLKLQDVATQFYLFHRNEVNELFHKFSKKRRVKLDNALIDMLQHLREGGYVLGLVTLSSTERIEKVLRNTKSRKYFDFVESASKEFQETPNMEWKKNAYQCFLERYRFQSGEVICVGDSPCVDLNPAKSLGMETILIIHDYNRELEQESLADHILYRDTFQKTLLSVLARENRTRV